MEKFWRLLAGTAHTRDVGLRPVTTGTGSRACELNTVAKPEVGKLAFLLLPARVQSLLRAFLSRPQQRAVGF